MWLWYLSWLFWDIWLANRKGVLSGIGVTCFQLCLYHWISIKEILRRDNHIQIYLPADDPEAEQFLHGYVGSLRCSVYQARGDRKICLAAYRTHHSGRGDRLVHNILLRKKISQDLLVRAHDFRLGMVDRTMAMGHRLAADRRSETFQQSDG